MGGCAGLIVYIMIFDILNLVRKLQTWDPIFDPS